MDHSALCAGLDYDMGILLGLIVLAFDPPLESLAPRILASNTASGGKNASTALFI